jgi:hypothetical protein
LSEAKRLGNFSPLTPGEIEMAQAIYQLPTAQGRAWEYWETRLAKRGGMPARTTKIAARKTAARKRVTPKGGKRK